MMSDCRWLGGHGLTGSYSNYNIVSSLSYDSFANPVSFKTYHYDGANTSRSTDLFGYTRARYQELGETLSDNFLLCETSDPSAGLVEFKMKLQMNDMATNNAFGGIMLMGLYSLDYRKMLSKGVPFNRSIDKDVDTGDDMEFRLFSRKVFNESITATSDRPPTYNAIGSNGLLTIKWRLEFL